MRGKEAIITKARESGATADEALASTANAEAEDQLATVSSDDEKAKLHLRMLKDFENSIEAGFQMATFQGPLCAEPVVGMGWVVENVEYHPEDDESEQGKQFGSIHCAECRPKQDVCRGGSPDLFGQRQLPSRNAGLVTSDQARHVYL